MNNRSLPLLILSTLPFMIAPAFAQVDAIPDPHQDFYEQSKPKRAPDLKKLPPVAPNYSSERPGSAPTAPSEPTAYTRGKSGNDLDDAMSMPENGPKTAPDRNSNDQIDAVAPSSVPAVTHPELLPRPPIPAPPAVSLLPPMNGGQQKENLSWRTRAYKLRSENTDTRGGLTKSFRLINASFEDTIGAVTGACASRGLVIDASFESAGQFLVHPSDAVPERSRIIISVKPISKTTTLVRVGLDADNRSKQVSFDDLLNQVESAISDKGLL